MNTRPLYLRLFLLLGVTAAAAPAQTSSSLPPMSVVGSKEAVQHQVGSTAFVSAEDIRLHNDFNVNSLLQRVPGVFVREEDGFGNFPNISLRGADGTRTEKASVMEDGILSAPAPYSAPGAYYSPTTGRMSGIEILKGSSQVRFGPHTTGGAINFLSTPVPDAPEGRLRLSAGEFNTQTVHLTAGGSEATEKGRLGGLVEVYGQRSDGFRSMEKVGGDTGFERVEPMVKLFWEPVSAVPQRFEIKLGYTDFNADETYLGLSEADLRARPYSRYAATQFDNIDTEHTRSYLRYIAGTPEGLQLESVAYYNQFERNWYKIDQVSTAVAPALNPGGSIEPRVSLHKALLGKDGTLAVLKGDAPGSIGVKANAREYASYGWQNELRKGFSTGEIDHLLRGGLRVHHDYEDRFQFVDVYSGAGDGRFDLFRKGPGGEDADRRQETTATAIFLEDELRHGALTLKPGVRWEFLDQRAENRGKVVEGSFDTWAAGMGFAYDLSPGDTLFGGLYRGISTPGPDARLNNGIREEESLSSELGFRHSRSHHAFEVAAFHTGYENLVGTDTGLGLGGGSNVNAGEARVYGVEGLLSANLTQDRPLRVPAYVSLTWTQAELRESLATGGGSDIYSGGDAGADLPYVPEWKLTFGVALEQGPWSLRLDGTWVDETFGTASNESTPVGSAREGLIDDAWLFNLAGGWQATESLRLFAGVRNLFDETVVTSRIPEGPRSGAPRQAYVGVDMKW